MNDLREQLADICSDATLRPHGYADAIIAAMPGMVQPLVWEGVEADCFVICELDGRSYELCVVDTLERPCDYLWSVTYYLGRQGARIMCGKPETFESAKSAAQKHHVATILSAFGVQGGET